jgi:hypothetical protein
LSHQWVNVFIDESGTNELDSTKHDVSNLYICVAVMVNSCDLDRLSDGINNIKNKFCSGGEIKSSNIGSNHKRRLKILQEIELLPFRYYAQIINKERIYKDSGLKYKKSFYKVMHRKLYEMIPCKGNSIKVIIDEYGSEDFKEEFKKYLDIRGIPNLYAKFDHDFARSNECHGIQLADFIAGTLLYCFDSKKKSDYSLSYREKLTSKEIAIDCWPPIRNETNACGSSNKWDSMIWDHAIEKCIEFIETNESADIDDCKMQRCTLERLLFARKYESIDNQNIYSEELIEFLVKSGFEKLSDRDFKSKIITALRNHGIIITGSNKGYTIALTYEEIKEYLKHNKGIILPMIRKIKKAQEEIKKATNNNLDILLEDSKFKILDKLSSALYEFELEENTEKLAEEENYEEDDFQ